MTAIAAAILIAIVVLSYRQYTEYRRASAEVSQSREVVETTGRLLSSLLDAETGQRGFVLTGERRYLDAYQLGIGTAPAELTNLKALVGGSIEELTGLIQQKLAELAQTVVLRQSAGMKPALDIILSGRGEQLMSRIRQILTELQRSEQTDIVNASRERERAARGVLLVTGIGSLVLLVFFIGGNVAIARVIRGREAALAQAETARESLATTLASIGDGVIATDPAGCITLVNPVAQTLMRAAENELVGRNFDDVFRLINEFTRERVESPIAKVLRAGGPAGLANHTLLIAADGTEVPIDDSGAPIRRGSGPIEGTVMVFREISARRAAEATGRLLRSIVEQSADGIISTDWNGVVTSWNAGAERIYGYSAEEITGKPIALIAPPDRLGEQRSILERAACGEAVSQFETERLKKSGELVDVSVSASAVKDATGRPVGASLVVRDITERKHKEQARLELAATERVLAAERALREVEAELARMGRVSAMGEMAAAIAHELNQPLAAIVTNAEAGARWLGNPTPNVAEARDSLALIARDGHRASEIIRRIRETVKGEPRPSELLDMNAVVLETAELARAVLTKSEASVRLELAEGLPSVNGYRIQLQEVLLNLITNGAEAMAAVADRPRELIVSTSRSEDAVRVQVRDAGAGIPGQQMSRMFQPFFTTKPNGMGIGLSLSRSVIEAHGGEIRAMRNEGPGVTVEFRLPAVKEATA